MNPLQKQFYQLLRESYPMMWRGVEEARLVAPELVDRHFERCLGWATHAIGPGALQKVADGYAFFTMEVNRAQRAYEAAGKYELSSFAEANRQVYQNSEYMAQYYWGVFAILFCWSHYVELMEFYLARFVRQLPSGRLLEVAPGHGAWGIIAVSDRPDLTLEGWDISPASLTIAPLMAAGAGVAERCQYRVGDATHAEPGRDGFDAAVCSFMLEHLEQPGAFLAQLAGSLNPGARAFVTLALTAGQRDHIYEFKRESEAILMAETGGFDVLESRMAQPLRLASNVRYIPRVQALILRKR